MNHARDLLAEQLNQIMRRLKKIILIGLMSFEHPWENSTLVLRKFFR